MGDREKGTPLFEYPADRRNADGSVTVGPDRRVCVAELSEWSLMSDRLDESGRKGETEAHDIAQGVK